MTHHAYYIEGDLALFGEYTRAIPHFLAQKHERFGIDESRELAARAGLKVLGERALFLIGASTLTSEAQQALLKLFEEPQPGVVFVFVVPHGTLLSTLRSRMLEYPENLKLAGQKVLGSPRPAAGQQARPDYFAQQVSDFLKANQKERSAQIAALLKDEEDVKERVRTLLSGLEVELAKHMGNPQARAGLGDIAKVRSYVGDRSPALKMLLEHLAVSLPTI